jgi:hypothetical protein
MEPRGGPFISDELLEQKRRFAREIFGEMEADERKQKYSRALVEVIGLAFAVAGVVLSLYGNLFAEKEEGLRGLWRVLWGPGGIQELELSDLMQQQPKSESDKLTRRIYVFALDVSGSAQTGKVTEEDWRLFTERVQSDGLQMCEGLETFDDGMNKWHLARAQTCCYLKSLREGDYVALWKFGATASLISGHKIFKLVRDETTDEMPGFGQMRAILMDHSIVPVRGSADYNITNFEQLLDTLYKTYIEDPSFEKDELHFAIISDFMHDLGSKGQLSYSTSMQKIADRFHNMGQVRHAMFHLVASTTGNHEVNSVVPIMEDAAGWYQYRFDSFDRPSTRSRSIPDFFYGFAKSPKNIVFYHMAGSTDAVPIRLIWDKKVKIAKGSSLTVGLMTDVYSASDQDLAVYVAEGWPEEDCAPLEHASFPENRERPGDMQTAILRPKGRQSFEVKRSHDYICVQPLSVEKGRVYNYKLTLSRAGQGQERNIYLVDVKFQQYLPPLAAWTLVICTVTIVLVVVCWAFIYGGDRLRVRMNWRRRPHREAEPVNG